MVEDNVLFLYMAIVGASLSKRIKLLHQIWLETGIRLGIYQQCGCSSLVYAVFLRVTFLDHGFLIASCRYESWLEVPSACIE